MSKHNHPIVMYNERDNRILYQGIINEEGCSQLKMLLFDIENRMMKSNIKQPIRLCIDSEGGSYVEGMAICDIIEALRVPVYTYAVGLVASAAFKIFISGKKRFTYKHSMFLFHSAAGGAIGTQKDIEKDLADFKRINNEIREYVKRKTKLPHSMIDDTIDNCKDLWLTADDAIRYGIADILLK